MLLPHQPETPLIERLRFLTDVLTSKDGSEQRVNLRVAPRQEFDFELLLEDSDRAWLENRLFSVALGGWEVPVWHEPMMLNAAASSAAAAVVVVSASYVDFRAGCNVMVWQDENTYDLLENCTLAGSTITSADSTLSRSYGIGTAVYVTRPAELVSRPKVSRYSRNLTRYNLTYAVTDNNIAIADSSAFTQLNSKPVLNDANAIEDVLGEGWEREAVFIDNATGIFSSLSFWDVARRVSNKTFKTRTPQRLWEVRQLLHWMRGRQRSFYLPTFARDFAPAANIVSAATTIDVDNVGYTDWTTSRQPRNIIRVVKTDGTSVTRTVSSSVEVSESVERLTVTSGWPGNVSMSDIDRIEVVEKVRMDTDDVVIEHSNALGQSKISFPVRAVIE